MHHRDFPFEDGTKRNKYLVVLGEKPGLGYLCVLATTKQWVMKAEYGCHHNPRTHFFITGDGKNFFQRDTWLVLSHSVIMSSADMIDKGFANVIEVAGNLKENITGEIRNCLKMSKDISKNELQFL